MKRETQERFGRSMLLCGGVISISGGFKSGEIGFAVFAILYGMGLLFAYAWENHRGEE